MATAKLKWIVVNVSRGLFDGHYDSEEMAKQSARLWAEKFPADDTILVAAVTARISGPAAIPNDRFIPRVLRRAS